MGNSIGQAIKQALLSALRKAGKKLLLQFLKWALAMFGPWILIGLLVVSILAGVYGGLASGDYNNQGSFDKQKNEQLVQPYKDAVNAVNPPLDTSDGGTAGGDNYQLDWGILYAIDTLGNEHIDPSNLKDHALAMAKMLAPIYTYQEVTVSTTQNGKTTTSTQKILVKVDTYMGTYTFHYSPQTTSYKNGQETMTQTTQVFSGATFAQDYTRLDKVICQFDNMKFVSESDRQMVLQLAQGIDNQQANLDWMTGTSIPMGNNGAFIGEVPYSMMSAFVEASKAYGIPTEILMAIAKKESTFNPKALGPVCADGQQAEGLMQFKPSTWKTYGVDANKDGSADPYDPIDAIFSAAKYLKYLEGVVGSLNIAIKDYGEGTDAYMNEVLAIAQSFKMQLASPNSLSHYVWPVQGTSFSGITQLFGNPDGTPKGHDGLDIGASTGTPILATVSGTIVQLDTPSNDPAGGNAIYLKGVDGNYWYFCHLSAFNVQQGQQVQAGQVIGYVGETGHATGPHLHLGLITSGSITGPWVDPLSKFQQ